MMIIVICLRQGFKRRNMQRFKNTESYLKHILCTDVDNLEVTIKEETVDDDELKENDKDISTISVLEYLDYVKT